MEKLKAILAAKQGQPKVVNNRQIIEQKKIQFFADQKQSKKQDDERKKRKFEELDQFYDQKRKMIKKNEEKDPTKDMTKEEIIIKLREFGQPITIFGEDDSSRKSRLESINRSYELQGGKKKLSRQDEAYQRQLKEAEEYEELNAKFRPKLIEPRLMDDLMLRNRKLVMIQQDVSPKYQDICDSIFLWISKVLKDWNQALELKYHTPQEKANGKINILRYEQTASDIQSFFKVLKVRAGDQQMVTSIFHIMNCCLVREYIQANDKYIELSIGTAPWPMGVAMLGITIRNNSVRLAHVLNQETTRKWMQTIKRIISISQEFYPNQDRMKAVYYSVNSLI